MTDSHLVGICWVTIIIIIAIIFVIAIMLRFQEILNALGLFEMFGVGLQNGQKKMIQMMTMITM